jgi:hypothetical protein
METGSRVAAPALVSKEWATWETNPAQTKHPYFLRFSSYRDFGLYT